MRIKILCQNRVGILRDMLNLLVDYGINVARGEVGGEQGNAVYLHCPNLMNLQLQALRPKIEALPGVFELRKVSLMPSERHSLELNALLGALDFPVLSIDMSGAIVAANRAAAQLLGVRVDEVPGMSLSRYAEDFDPPRSYVRQVNKDLKAVAHFVEDLRLELPLLEIAVRQYGRYADAGNDMEDGASVSRLYQAKSP